MDPERETPPAAPEAAPVVAPDVETLRSREPEPLGYGGHRTRCTDMVIVKLCQGEPARRRLAAAIEGRGETPALARLVERGHARQIVPVFRAEIGESGGFLRSLALAVEPEQPRRAARGLMSVLLDPSTNAHELASHLSTLGDEVEYAFVPPIRRLFLPRLRRAPSRRRQRGDPLSSRQWAHGAVRIHQARAKRGFVEAAGVTVAVVDSGIDAGHPDLAGSIASYANYVSAEDDRDLIGHGTHVSGIVAAGINNDVGVAGLCAARIMAVKALPLRDEDYVPAEYYRALAHPIDNGAKVINLSLGGELDPAERDIIQDALDAGIVVVAAMGNEYQDGNPKEYPAGFEGVIAVGACDEMDRRAEFSNTGKHIGLLAPGVRILSTTPRYPSKFARRLLYDSWPGTSMATPHVAAAAALLLAKRPRLTPAQVRKHLMRKADPVPGQKSRPDTEHGWGRLNIEAALE